MGNNIKTKEMNYGQFIEKLNELHDKGLIDVAAKYDVMDWGQELSVNSFERGLKDGMDICK